MRRTISVILGAFCLGLVMPAADADAASKKRRSASIKGKSARYRIKLETQGKKVAGQCFELKLRVVDSRGKDATRVRGIKGTTIKMTVKDGRAAGEFYGNKNCTVVTKKPVTLKNGRGKIRYKTPAGGEVTFVTTAKNFKRQSHKVKIAAAPSKKRMIKLEPKRGTSLKSHECQEFILKVVNADGSDATNAPDVKDSSIMVTVKDGRDKGEFYGNRACTNIRTQAVQLRRGRGFIRYKTPKAGKVTFTTKAKGFQTKKYDITFARGVRVIESYLTDDLKSYLLHRCGNGNRRDRNDPWFFVGPAGRSTKRHKSIGGRNMNRPEPAIYRICHGPTVAGRERTSNPVLMESGCIVTCKAGFVHKYNRKAVWEVRNKTIAQCMSLRAPNQANPYRKCLKKSDL